MLLFALFLAFAVCCFWCHCSKARAPIQLQQKQQQRLPIYRHKNNSAPCSSYVFVYVSSVWGIVFLRYNLVATSCGPNRWRDVHSACRTEPLVQSMWKNPHDSGLRFASGPFPWVGVNLPVSNSSLAVDGCMGAIGCEARCSDAWDSPDSFWEGWLNMLKSGNLSTSLAVIFSGCMWVLQCPTWFILHHCYFAAGQRCHTTLSALTKSPNLRTTYSDKMHRQN